MLFSLFLISDPLCLRVESSAMISYPAGLEEDEDDEEEEEGEEEEER